MNYDPNWTDEEFLVAAIMDAVHGLSLADHAGDAMNEAINLAALNDPEHMNKNWPTEGMTASERTARYRRIVTPIMAQLPCFAWWHGEPMDEEEADCRREEWHYDKCPVCQARERMQQEPTDG